MTQAKDNLQKAVVAEKKAQDLIEKDDELRLA